MAPILTLSLLLPASAVAPQATGPFPEAVLASISRDAAHGHDGVVGDAALLRREPGALGHRAWPEDAWAALFGDLDGDGVPDLPDGVDALTEVRRPWQEQAWMTDLWFSMDRDAYGFSDGDVLRLTPAGPPEVVHREDELRAALGLSGGTFDVDALAVRKADGALCFSLRDGAAGTALGDLADGDVVAWLPDSGEVTILAREADFQAWVEHALGRSPGPIGDVKAIAFRPADGALCFTVQSPSDQDATVFSTAGGGEVVVGLEEAGWGFRDSFELDALTFAGAQEGPTLTLTVSDRTPAAGEVLHVTVRHATPGAQLTGWMSPRARVRRLALGGIGWVLPDQGAGFRPWPFAGDDFADAEGEFHGSLKVDAPVVGGGREWVLQVVDVDGNGLSTPVRIHLR